MGLEKTDLISIGANKVGNASAVTYGLAWLAEKFSSFGVQEWVAIAVGAAAVFSYLTAGLANLAKMRKINEEVE